MKIEILANAAEFTPNFRNFLLRNFFITLTSTQVQALPDVHSKVLAEGGC
jgi:hypothetical protein